MSLDDKFADVHIARRVKELSENEGLRLILESLRAAYLEGIAQSDPGDPDLREDLYRYYRCSLDLEAQMVSLINAGSISKYQIDQIVTPTPH
jgi:hypothetical protein